jgi:hypothetical protein
MAKGTLTKKQKEMIWSMEMNPLSVISPNLPLKPKKERKTIPLLPPV